MTLKLGPDEKALAESFERGDWKPLPGYEIARMRELAQQKLRVDIEAGFNTFTRSHRHSLDAESGRRLAGRTKTDSRPTRSTKL